MKNKTLISLVVLFVFACAIVLFVRLHTKNAPTYGKNTQGKEACYALFGNPNERGAYDATIARFYLTKDDGSIIGSLSLLPGEKDSKTGNFTGTFIQEEGSSWKKADLTWHTFAEGMEADEELSLLFDDTELAIGFGAQKAVSPTHFIYENPEKISYTERIPAISCGDLDERDAVISYFKNNVNTIAPHDALLGGSWYTTSIFVDPKKNAGTVWMEDGHISEKHDFGYLMNGRGEIVSISFADK